MVHQYEPNVFKYQYTKFHAYIPKNTIHIISRVNSNRPTNILILNTQELARGFLPSGKKEFSEA